MGPHTPPVPRVERRLPITAGNLASANPVLTPPRLLDVTVDLTDSPGPSQNPASSSASLSVATVASTPPSSSNEISCPVCLDTKSRVLATSRRMVSTLCGHIFCSRCLPTCIQNDGKCPSCRRPLNIRGYHDLFF